MEREILSSGKMSGLPVAMTWAFTRWSSLRRSRRVIVPADVLEAGQSGQVGLDSKVSHFVMCTGIASAPECSTT